MFEKFKEKARKRSAANIAALVSQLIDVANRVEEKIGRHETPNPADVRSLHRLQNDLFLELAGPLSLKDVKENIIDPALAGLNVSNGAKIAVNHVYQTTISNLGEN